MLIIAEFDARFHSYVLRICVHWPVMDGTPGVVFIYLFIDFSPLLFFSSIYDRWKEDVQFFNSSRVNFNRYCIFVKFRRNFIPPHDYSPRVDYFLRNYNSISIGQS